MDGFQLAAACAGEQSNLAFDLDEARHRCFDSEEVLRQMIQCFFDDFDALVFQAESLLEKCDLAPLGRLGHRTKGSLVFLAADEAAQAAERVELLCESGPCDPTKAAEAVHALQRQCRRLEPTLRAFLLAAESNGRPRVPR